MKLKLSFLTDENKKSNNQGNSFYSILKNFIENSLVFKTIYEQGKYNFNKIKLILFYDAIYKYYYEDDLQKVMNEIIDMNDTELIEKIQFQCIYVKSSYLLGNVTSMENDLESLKYEYKIMKNELKEINELLEQIMNKMENIWLKILLKKDAMIKLF